MSFGVYIVGNDKVCDHVVALVNSLRYYNPKVAITLIPYDSNYQKVLAATRVELFNDLPGLMEISLQLQKTLSQPGAPAHSNKYARLHNLATWLGDYDDFVSLDADIVFFTDIEPFAYKLLNGYDFACYDRTYIHNGRWVFTDKARELYSKEAYRRLFNNGFWVSRKGLFTKEKILEHLEECTHMYEYFDFKSGVIAQPIINSLVLDSIPLDKINNYLAHNKLPEPWVGFKYQEVQPHILGTPNSALPFIHWAGREICKETRYWEIWEYYFNISSQ